MSQDRYLTEYGKFVHGYFRAYASFLIIALAAAVVIGVVWEHPAAFGLSGALVALWLIGLLRCIASLQREGKHCRTFPDQLDQDQIHRESEYLKTLRGKIRWEKNFFQSLFLAGLTGLVVLLLTGHKDGLTGVALGIVLTTSIEQIALVLYDHGLQEFAYQLEKRS
ncbi:MAG: hypothetical protein KDC28_12835 [Saprospiraceae bacterium]|nr:hypothetical protein [Saprospiraceae bacterium]MCB9321067.1 hypothetical protein [Lewinellaceae bacterium]